MSAATSQPTPPTLAAFHDAMAAAYHVSIDPPAAVTACAAALELIGAAPELDPAELEQLTDTEVRLLTKLAWCDPVTNLELLMKAERAIVGLFRSLEDGERKEEVDLGRGALRDVRAAICANAELPAKEARGRATTDTHRHIEPWAANLILSGVNRLDCAITAFGSVMMELDNDPERDDACQVQAIHWLYEMLRDEAHNIRNCVGGAQGKSMRKDEL